MEFLAIYLFLINALGCYLMLADKRRAKKNLWRIPERTLLTVAALGGSFGALLAMRRSRHKTRKDGFSVGITGSGSLHPCRETKAIIPAINNTTVVPFFLFPYLLFSPFLIQKSREQPCPPRLFPASSLFSPYDSRCICHLLSRRLPQFTLSPE